MPPKVIAVSLQKGGVGKTTTSVNLAASMAGHLGLRTYLFDFDGQCNATKAVLGHLPTDGPDIVSLLKNEATFEQVAVQSPHDENLYVVPGSKTLPRLEIELAEKGIWRTALREAPRQLRAMIPADAGAVIIDTPPSLGLWLQVALGLADEVLVVARPEEFSIDGMQDLLATVDTVREHVNRRLRVAAVLLNGVEEKTNEHSAFTETCQKLFGDHLLNPHLPKRIVIATSQRTGVPLEYMGDKEAGSVRTFFRQLAVRLYRGATAPKPAAVSA